MERFGERSESVGDKLLKYLAYPEGFEPLTLRSEVPSSPFSYVITHKKGPLFMGRAGFLFLPIRFISCESGNNFGKKRNGFGRAPAGVGAAW
jgi:hypothetical protein